MFVSHKYKLLFFEVPRTASRSVSAVLANVDPESPTSIKRRTESQAYSYHLFDQNLLAAHPEYHLIAAHRNPYHRLYSHYKYRARYGNPNNLKSLSFDEYVRWVYEPASRPDLSNAMVDSAIVELLPYEKVDFWLRFETLNDDWLALQQTLGYALPALPKINGSGSLGIHQPYTPELAQMVLNRFKDDFLTFGYSADSWHTQFE